MIKLVLVTALCLFNLGGVAMATETPEYTVLEADGAFELRAYEPIIVAETQVRGGRREAVNGGFRRLADYIFGGNQSGQKIAMTSPVTQELGAEAASDAGPDTAEGWRVGFLMPKEYTLDALPTPEDTAVRLTEKPARRIAAVQFSGNNSDDKLADHLNELRGWMAERGLKPAGAPTFAYYDPPWTLPWLKRNEVLIPVVEDA
ncbi:MAG: heme-binding protein [Maricaulaceae bacterium]